MSDTLQDKWNQRYSEADISSTSIAEILHLYHHLLPDHGYALDLACGLGGNALLLARSGLQVDAWDISDVAINHLARTARQEGLPITTLCCDLTNQRLPDQHYDLILVSHFLDRTLAPAIISALRPGGLLFYQTWTIEKPDTVGPNNPLFLLQPNELLKLFAPLRIVAYLEEGRIGDLSKGVRGEALLVAQHTH